jgi:hypothetical protein
VLDILVAPFQPISDDPAVLSRISGGPWWEGELPSADAWATCRAALGGAVISEIHFHPFFHEIVSVEPADDPDAEPILIDEYWPGLLVGGLLLIRSGVAVRAGVNVLDPLVSTSSCLYWSWWRRNRRVRDMSHPWGGNSQWGTDFRRDYIVGDELYYNVDWLGVAPTERFPSRIPEKYRAPLLRHRCSTHIDLGDDEFPYEESLVERRRP